MIRLDSSLHTFNPRHFGRVADLKRSAEKGRRDTLMIACADHGSAPDHVSFARREQFFVLQHLAGSVPAYRGCPRDDCLANLEYAFACYEIRHVVICGHLGCGVIPHWLSKRKTREPGGLCLDFAQTTLPAVQEAYPDLSGAALIERLICEHALFQLENLQSHPFIQHELEHGLRLHLWIVNDDTARVLSFHPNLGGLVPVESW